jgi:hypothetical protein
MGLAITDTHGAVIAPAPMAPVHETDIIILPQGLNALKQVAKQVGVDLRGASCNLNGGCDAARHRRGLCRVGLIPTIIESPHQRKTTPRGRTRRFNAALHAWRMRVERTLAWEDTYQRV